MKKLLYLLTGILLAAFILPSCSSSLSITKRRYTRGYFVEHIRGKHKQPRVNENDRQNATAMAQAEEKEAFRAVEYLKVPRIDKAAETFKATAAVTAPKIRDRKSLDGDHTPIGLALRQPVKALKIASNLTSEAAAQDEALSLLWIVIVVVLIVYILGIIMDGFGLGELIHILGVVILALLILWLLRIL